MNKSVFTCITLLLISFITFSCQNSTKTELEEIRKAELQETQNIELIKELYTLLDKQDLEACSKFVTADNECYMGSSDEAFTFSDMIPFIQMYYTSFPDYKHTIENIFATDRFVVAQLLYTGTHSNEFMGILPTGNKIKYKGIFIFEIENQKISKIWAVEDESTLMAQLESKSE